VKENSLAVKVDHSKDVAGYNYQEFRYDGDHEKYPGRILHWMTREKYASAYLRQV